MIVANNDGRLGIIEIDQFKALLDKSLLEYVAWTEEPIKTQQDLRKVIRADDDHSLIARGGMNWIARSPVIEASVNQAGFERQAKVDGAREASIWKKQTREKLSSPIKLLARSAVDKDQKIHIARIPPRAARPKGVGHVKPDSNREAVWLRSRPISLAGTPPVGHHNWPEDWVDSTNGFTNSSNSRALELASAEYSVGWLFVITKCDDASNCKLGQSNEADCLNPETLTDHVFGMTHLVIPRRYLYASNENNTQAEAIGSDILKGGGLALLTGADYDYVSLRVSHYPAGGRKPFGIDKKSDSSAAEPSHTDEKSNSSAAEPSHTKETSIAMLNERLHEILATINRADDLDEGDLVLILPTALDFKLGEGDYLIVGFEEIPPPLRSHYRGGPGIIDPPTVETGRVDIHIRADWSVTQGRRPAVRIKAAVDE